jgi:hypothetical protein
MEDKQKDTVAFPWKELLIVLALIIAIFAAGKLLGPINLGPTQDPYNAPTQY